MEFKKTMEMLQHQQERLEDGLETLKTAAFNTAKECLAEYPSLNRNTKIGLERMSRNSRLCLRREIQQQPKEQSELTSESEKKTPQDWKDVNIVSIFKKGSKKDIGNY